MRAPRPRARLRTDARRRLKKVQGKKKRDAQEADRVKALEGAPPGLAGEVEDGTAGPGDLLATKDEDVIF